MKKASIEMLRVCFINSRRVCAVISQGLKPLFIPAIFGTTEQAAEKRLATSVDV
jgi:hypothetical protein